MSKVDFKTMKGGDIPPLHANFKATLSCTKGFTYHKI